MPILVPPLRRSAFVALLLPRCLPRCRPVRTCATALPPHRPALCRPRCQARPPIPPPLFLHPRTAPVLCLPTHPIHGSSSSPPLHRARHARLPPTASDRDQPGAIIPASLPPPQSRPSRCHSTLSPSRRSSTLVFVGSLFAYGCAVLDPIPLFLIQ